MEPLTPAELRRLRTSAQLLHPARRSPERIVRHQLAVQAQDLRHARLALRARSSGLTSAAIDRALTDGRALVVAWLNRGTLHLVAAEDWSWLLQLTAPGRTAGVLRRLSQEDVGGLAADRGVALVERALSEDGPLERQDLRDRLAGAGVRTEGQAFGHLLALAALRGVAVRGPVRDGRQYWVHARDWLGDPPPFDRERALAELARRYLAAHGPARDRDLAQWSGLSLRDARSGLRSAARSLRLLPDGLIDLRRRTSDERSLRPVLLPAWDEYLLGWHDRRFVAEGSAAASVYRGGVLGPAAIAAGSAVGTWRAGPRAGGRAPAIESFHRLPREVRAALNADARDIARFEAA